MDSSALYAMIFGSEKFYKYVGELQMATMMQKGGEEDIPEPLMAFKQTKREVQCAVDLAEKIQLFVEGNSPVPRCFAECPLPLALVPSAPCPDAQMTLCSTVPEERDYGDGVGAFAGVVARATTVVGCGDCKRRTRLSHECTCCLRHRNGTQPRHTLLAPNNTERSCSVSRHARDCNLEIPRVIANRVGVHLDPMVCI